MKNLLLLSCACAVLWAGCDRDEEEGRTEEQTATQERREGAAARKDEPRAQTGAEGAPGSAQPTDQPQAEEPGSARRAEAELSGVGDGRIEGKATLEERGDAVALTVRLENAAPGQSQVRIYERASCEGLDPKAKEAAPSGAPAMSDLGVVAIGADGKGVLEIEKESATLKPDDRASLLGKALVVQGKSANAPPGTARVPGATGDSVSCGMIRTAR